MYGTEPSAFSYSVGIPEYGSYAAEYLARTLPYQRFDAALAGGSAGLGPKWVASSHSYDFFIHYTSPV